MRSNLLNDDGQRKRATKLWSIQGDAAAGVGAVEEGRRRWRSSGRVGVERKEEEEAAAGGKSENRGTLYLFIRQWIDGMGGNRGGQKMIMWLCERLDFREVH